MNCILCKNGVLAPGTTTVTLERQNAILVFKEVPARVCMDCGEAYVDEKTSRMLMDMAEKAVDEGVQVDIRYFKAA